MDLLKRLQKEIQVRGIKNLIVSKNINLQYFLGQEVAGELLVTQNSAKFLTSDFFKYTKLPVPIEVIIKREAKKQLKKLKGKIYCDDCLQKTRAKCTNIVEDLRSVKTKEELTLIKKAGKVSEFAMKRAKEGVEDKMNSWDIIELVVSTFRKNKCFNAFDTLVTINTISPHAKPENTKIKDKDLVIVDLGARYKNYCFDTSRTFCSNPSKKQQALFEILKQAQVDATINASVGEKLVDLENKVDDSLKLPLKKYKLTPKETFIHSLGHGVGLEVHERPFYSTDEIFEEGQVFTIEPGIYHPSFGGIRIEDTLVMGKKKTQNLCKFEKELH